MRHVRVLSLAVAVLAVGAVPLAARATTVALPAANGYVQCDTTAGVITSGASCASANDSASLSLGPVAGVKTYAYGQGLVDEAGAFGVLNYSLEVVGGAVGDVVPIEVDTTLQAIPYSIGYAFSEIGVGAATSQTVTICYNSGVGCGAGTNVSSFSGVLKVNAVSGTVYANAVHLEVEAGGALGPATDVDGGLASVDPHFFVNPIDINAGDYSILLSPGIGNSLPGGVPEPGAWTMLLLGVGLTGAKLRAARRKRGLAPGIEQGTRVADPAARQHFQHALRRHPARSGTQ